MARLRYNLLETTLGAQLNSGSTSITFAAKLTAADGDIPTISSGDYLPLIIENEIVHLTAYTSGATSGTIIREAEEGSGSDTTHSSGVKVRNVLTAWDHAGMGRHPRNLIDWLDAFGTPIYTHEFEGDTSSLPSGWSWVNQSTSTYAEKMGVGVLALPSAGSNNQRYIVRTAPSTPYTIEGMFSLGMRYVNYAEGGIFLRESSTGRFVILTRNNTPRVINSRWTNTTTFSAETTSHANVPRQHPFWLRVRVNSVSSMDFEYSYDGVTWSILSSATDHSSFLTVDEIGWGGQTTNSFPIQIACHYFRVY